MTPALGTEGLQYETIDVNIIPDLYVTWIVDIWRGDRNDPAVDVERYIGVWDAAVLEDEDGNAVDPSFESRRYGMGVQPTIAARHWEVLDHIKKSDSAARTFKKQQDDLFNPDSYAYGSTHTHKSLYTEFMNAIDVLVEQPDNKEAWEAVDAFRKNQAMQHEK